MSDSTTFELLIASMTCASCALLLKTWKPKKLEELE